MKAIVAGAGWNWSKPEAAATYTIDPAILVKICKIIEEIFRSGLCQEKKF